MKFVILVAAGKGERLGFNVPKALVLVFSKPMFMYPLKTILSIDVDKVLVGIPSKHEHKFINIINEYFDEEEKRRILIFKGGKERFETVKKGLLMIRKNKGSNDDLVAVHNAANIFATKEDFLNVFSTAAQNFSASVALRSVDTLRKVDDDNNVEKTYKRDRIWRMQTPQGMKYGKYLKAFKNNKKDVTDDLDMSLAAGFPAKIIESKQTNFKITYPFDLKVAELLLKEKYEKE